MSYKLIPCIYAGNLPSPVRDELQEWNDELCFHGDGGCVFTIRFSDIEQLKLFIEWMVSIDVWRLEETDLVSFSRWQQMTGKHESSTENYILYNTWRKEWHFNENLTVAMTGT